MESRDFRGFICVGGECGRGVFGLKFWAALSSRSEVFWGFAVCFLVSGFGLLLRVSGGWWGWWGWVQRGLGGGGAGNASSTASAAAASWGSHRVRPVVFGGANASGS